MSYSNINDAFNINSSFENTIRGLNSFNPINNTIENIRSSYNSNLNDSKPQFDSNYYNSNNPNNPNNPNDGM